MELFGGLENLDLFAVGVATAAIGILGFVVFFQNKNSVTSKSFLLFSFITIVWGIVNYTTYQTTLSPNIAFWLLRVTIFLGVWHAFSLFKLLYVFPKETFKFPLWFRYGVVPVVWMTSLLTLSSFVFQEIAEIDSFGKIIKIINGPGIGIFGVVVSGLIVGAIIVFFKTTSHASGIERKQFFSVLTGIIVTFTLLIVFNFIFPAFLNNSKFIPWGPVFIFPFIVATGYAILKHGLLRVKIIATEGATFALAFVALLEIILAHDFAIILFRSSVFVLVLVLGILLIRSVLEEVKSREKIEQLAKDLENANTELKKLDQAKSEFISIASHQLRAPLTAIKGYVSMIMEGSFGDVPQKAMEPLRRTFVSSEELVSLVADLLNLSRIESGKMKYDFKNINLQNIISGAVKELEEVAKKGEIAIEFSSKVQQDIYLNGDEGKLHEVFMNLLDNAIKYSPKGVIKIKIEKLSDKVAISVVDNGIGIQPEEISKLFSKFGRTEASQKIRPDGMGIGLYFVRRVVEDHKGRVWAKSEGEGKGSTFFVELPIV